MIYQGRVHKFGDNINTDDIIAGKYKHKTMDLDELSRHLMENIAPGFVKRVSPGDFIVGGKNFGCGSSREQAPQIIKHVSIAAVIAESFARIFFRNAINIGLMLIQCDTSGLLDGDLLVYDHAGRTVSVPARSLSLQTPEAPVELMGIIEAGGLLNFALKGGFR